MRKYIPIQFSVTTRQMMFEAPTKNKSLSTVDLVFVSRGCDVDISAYAPMDAFEQDVHIGSMNASDARPLTEQARDWDKLNTYGMFSKPGRANYSPLWLYRGKKVVLWDKPGEENLEGKKLYLNVGTRLSIRGVGRINALGINFKIEAKGNVSIHSLVATADVKNSGRDL